MKIAVLVKQTPDSAELPEVSADDVNRGLVTATMAINPWDVHAVEEAVRLGERFGAESIALSMGESTAADTLRHALSLGISNAVLIDNSGIATDIYATAEILAAAVNALESIDLVITGKQSVDAGTGSIPIGVACRLDHPLVTNVTKVVDVSDGRIVVERALGDILETVTVPLPAVISVGKEINDPRYPSYTGIRNANRAEIPVIAARELAPDGIAKKTVWTNARRIELANNDCELIEGANATEQATCLVDVLMGEKVV